MTRHVRPGWRRYFRRRSLLFAPRYRRPVISGLQICRGFLCEASRVTLKLLVIAPPPGPSFISGTLARSEMPKRRLSWRELASRDVRISLFKHGQLLAATGWGPGTGPAITCACLPYLACRASRFALARPTHGANQ